MTKIVFTPQAGDRCAPALNLLEVATVQGKGFLTHRGIVPPELLEVAVAQLTAYYESKGRGVPVVYTRQLGTEEWSTESVEVVVPDALPDNFA